jgi:hypothetical protein
MICLSLIYFTILWDNIYKIQYRIDTMILLKKEQTREKEIRARRQFEDVTQEVLKSQVFFFVLLKDLVASASDCNRMANRYL